MIELKDIMPTIAATIKSDNYFAAWTVVQDKGGQRPEIEAALASPGYLLVIELPLRGMLTRIQNAGTAHVWVTSFVHLQFAPNIAKDLDGMLVVDNLWRVLLSYNPAPDDQSSRFVPEDELFHLINFDQSLITITNAVKIETALGVTT